MTRPVGVADVGERAGALAPGGVRHGERLDQPVIADRIERLLRCAFEHGLEDGVGGRVVEELRSRRGLEVRFSFRPEFISSRLRTVIFASVSGDALDQPAGM